MRAEPTSHGFGIRKAVVKCAEASCLFVLGDAYRTYLAISIMLLPQPKACTVGVAPVWTAAGLA
jgi:hypothetical protein